MGRHREGVGRARNVAAGVAGLCVVAAVVALPALCGAHWTPSPAPKDHVGAVNAVDLADNGTASLLASGGEDGCVLAADLRCAPRASSPQAAVRLASGVTSLCFAAGGDPVLYAATESGALSLVDLRNPQHPLQLPVRRATAPTPPCMAMAGPLRRHGPPQSTLAPAHALLPLGDGRVLVGADDGSLSVVDARTR